MARIYSGKKGKSSSHKPLVKIKPRWVKLKKEEVEGLIEKLARQRLTSAQIGTILRDQYGIPDVKTITDKTISEIMREKGVYPEIPEDLMALLKKAVNLRSHLEKNKADKHSLRGLKNLESKIKRLGRYYSRKGILPPDWEYVPEKAKLMVQKW
ncbi:MAG: 30S ribosomal protein S15 [Candidatus Aenigmatarchaeota archaeon]